ncbi:MAG: ABC-2 family transporter protein [Pirellulaceae bacterium]
MKSVASRYFLLLKEFARTSFMADVEYRANIVMKVLTDFIWYAAQFFLFEVLFRKVSGISGWTLDTSRVFLGILFMVDAFYMIFFSENLDQFSDKVAKGDLDLILVKPVNSQFMVSTRKLNTAYFINIGLIAAWIGFAFSQMANPDWWRLLYLIPMVPCGLVVVYSVRFFFSLLSIIFTRAENINYVWFQIYKLGTRPDSLYPRWLRYTILTIVPVAFVASVPSRVVLGLDGVEFLGASLAIAVIFLYLTNRLWKYTLRFYTSASS